MRPHGHFMHFPLLYEINTRCWLRELSAVAGRQLTLAEVPQAEINSWRDLGFTHVWLMGVWRTGPRGRQAALLEAKRNPAFSAALPDWREEDIAGSPYAVADYTVAEELGGDVALAALRQRLAEANLKLVLDFVPNHVGLDHPWLRDRPDVFVQSSTQMPETIKVGEGEQTRWIAHGKDPNFPAWQDTVQLDYRNPATREAMISELLAIAQRCDGVRCDMAMLMLNDLFVRHWARFPFSHAVSEREFWAEAIAAVWRVHPEFLMISESYWGMESCLQTLGFDFTYDKILYDELVYHDPSAVTRHLFEECSAAFVEGSVHFIENHDERRAATLFVPDEHRAAALLTLGLPGLRLLHEGQLTGARAKMPVQLLRRPIEPRNAEVAGMYEQLLHGLRGSAVGCGQGKILRPRAAWPANQTWRNFVIVQWQSQPEEFDLVVVNLVPHTCQCYVPLTISNLASYHWSIKDRLGTERYLRVGSDLERQGLYLEVPPYAAQVFNFRPGG
jgi:hypothetical protein